MATIYAATDQTTKGIVAVKVLHPEHDKNPDLVRRFKQEGQLGAQIGHPNLVPAFDLGWLGGRHYIVMQLVRGERLGDTTRERPLPWPQTIPYVLDVLAALAALHARGVAHRDVSPNNCLLEPLDGGKRVRLLDLGNARVIDETDLVLPEIEATKGMIVWGTSRYIDPERLLGGPGDFRADLFSVGALWYTMLTGKTLPDPFELEPIEVLGKVQLPPRLLSVLRGALDRRERRHHSATSMADAIKAAMQDTPPRRRSIRAWWLAPALGVAVPAWFAWLHVVAPEKLPASPPPAAYACAGPQDSPVRLPPVMLAALTPAAPKLPATTSDGPASESLIDEPTSGLPTEGAQPTPKRRRPFDLRAELGKCKSHPSARLTVEFSPEEAPKVNGGQPRGAVGRCVERVLRQHPPRHAVTMSP
jgi:serine/threonine protein kinase